MTSTIPESVTYPPPGAYAAATVGDAMERFGVARGISPLWDSAVVSGPAVTVLTRPGDNKGVHAALEEVRAGDILVVDGGADETRALIGELVAEKAKALGVGGIVLDGAARDAVELRGVGVPVFARAVTPAGPWKTGPFRLGGIITLGGVPVAPGDWIVGDADGVSVVARERILEVAATADELVRGEADRRTTNRALTPRG